jgi:CheY-like chemotaxis protein
VEDERIVARDLQAMLQQLGYSVPAIAVTGADAIAKATALRPDLVLMDIRLQGAIDGIETAATILMQFDVPVIYLTAFTDAATRQRGRRRRRCSPVCRPACHHDDRSSEELSAGARRAREPIARLSSLHLNSFLMLLTRY